MSFFEWVRSQPLPIRISILLGAAIVHFGILMLSLALFGLPGLCAYGIIIMGYTSHDIRKIRIEMLKEEK